MDASTKDLLDELEKTLKEDPHDEVIGALDKKLNWHIHRTSLTNQMMIILVTSISESLPTLSAKKLSIILESKQKKLDDITKEIKDMDTELVSYLAKFKEKTDQLKKEVGEFNECK